MKVLNEQDFEEHIAAALQSLGYTSSHSSQYNKELCLLTAPLISFLETTQKQKWQQLLNIYNHDPQRIFQDLSAQIAARGTIDLLRNGISVRGVHVKLCYFQPKSTLNPEHAALYQENRLNLVRQLYYSNKNNNSLDMLLFVNGLPLITMELKNNLSGQNIADAEAQYRLSRDAREPLFSFKRCVAHFCVDNNRVSMTTRLQGSETSFLPYNKGIDNPAVTRGYRSQYFWQEVLKPSSLLDILENFVHIWQKKEFFFDDEEQKTNTKSKELLIFPRYHQLDLIHCLKEDLHKEGVGKKYLVQHATGSGKSYSIAWLAHALASLHEADNQRVFNSVIVVSDRKVLDEQLKNIIQSFTQVVGVVQAAKDSQELKESLERGQDIIITTIQKFPFISETIAALREYTFAVIIDEVHSSQSGEFAKELRKSLSKESTEDDFDYENFLKEEILRQGPQPHISFFGFTGTPKKETLELFGSKTAAGQFEAFHSYSMQQSISEGFSLDVLKNYTTYKRYFHLKQNSDFEVPAKEGKRELIRYVDGHQMTIQLKVETILDHWRTRGEKGIKGCSRGMIVTSSRELCVRYFKEINRQLEQHNSSYRCLLAFSGEIFVDGERLSETSCNLKIGSKGDLAHALKNPKYRLLVVANKFQTGFDEPLMQAMYVDKKLSGVHCVQTLSRLNRPAAAKTQTFILDFVNDFEDVEQAFEKFYTKITLEKESDPQRLYEVQRELKNFQLYSTEDIKAFCKMFYDPQGNKENLHPILDRALDKFNLLDEQEKRDFRTKTSAYIRMYAYFSQIISFDDIELEEHNLFLSYLYEKLPLSESEHFDITSSIQLEDVRVQKMYEHNAKELLASDNTLSERQFKTSASRETEHTLLSNIIQQLHDTFGITLNEEDKNALLQFFEKIKKDSQIGSFMSESNSQADRKEKFRERSRRIMIADFHKGSFPFYKDINNNNKIADTFFTTLYNECMKDKGLN